MGVDLTKWYWCRFGCCKLWGRPPKGFVPAGDRQVLLEYFRRMHAL